MIILVTGGRDYADREKVASTLNQLSPAVVFHGGATGADTLAAEWAKANRVPQRILMAPWTFFKGGAGPRRNGWLLEYADLFARTMSSPLVVVAFPGGRGTADMVRRALRGGQDVMKVTP